MGLLADIFGFGFEVKLEKYINQWNKKRLNGELTDYDNDYLYNILSQNLKVIINYQKIERLWESTEGYGFPLMFALQTNNILNLSSEKLFYLIKNSDLTQQNRQGRTPLMFVLASKMDKTINLSNEQLDYLIKNSDLNQVDEYSRTPLMIALITNKKPTFMSPEREQLILTPKQLDYLIKNSDLKKVDKDGWSPLMYVLRYNKGEGLNLTNEQLDYLIKNSDLKQVDKEGWNPLMYVLRYNKGEGLNLTNEQLDYLIKNSDVNQKTKLGWCPLMHVFRNNKDEELNVTTEQLDYLIKNTSEILFKEKVANWGATILLCYLDNEIKSNIYLSPEQFDNVLKKSDLSYTNANSSGKNWITLYFDSKISKKLPTTNYTLAKIFEESIKNQDLLEFTIQSFMVKNKSGIFNLEPQHYEFLIDNLDFTKKSSNEILKAYLLSKDEQKIKISEKTFDILISNVSFDPEIFKLLSENMSLLNEKQIETLKEKEIKEYSKLMLDIDSVILILKDKIKKTNHFDLKPYEDKMNFFEKEFTRIVKSIKPENPNEFNKFASFVIKLSEEDKIFLRPILIKINPTLEKVLFPNKQNDEKIKIENNYHHINSNKEDNNYIKSSVLDIKNVMLHMEENKQTQADQENTISSVIKLSKEDIVNRIIDSKKNVNKDVL